MAPPAQTTLTAVAIGLGAVSMLGGGVWFADPAHRNQARDEYHMMAEKVRKLEQRAASFTREKVRKQKEKLREFFHRADKDGDGHLSPEEVVQAPPELDKTVYFGIVEWPPTTNEELFVAANAALLGIGLFYYFFLRSTSAPLPLHGKATLTVKCLRARNLINADLNQKKPADKSDAYVVARVGREHFNTKTVQDNLNPQWEHQFPLFHLDFDNKKVDYSKLLIEVFDYDNIFKSDSLGTCAVQISDFVGSPNVPVHVRKVLEHGEGAEIELECTYAPVAAKR